MLNIKKFLNIKHNTIHSTVHPTYVYGYLIIEINKLLCVCYNSKSYKYLAILLKLFQKLV